MTYYLILIVIIEIILYIPKLKNDKRKKVFFEIVWIIIFIILNSFALYPIKAVFLKIKIVVVSYICMLIGYSLVILGIYGIKNIEEKIERLKKCFKEDYLLQLFLESLMILSIILKSKFFY